MLPRNRKTAGLTRWPPGRPAEPMNTGSAADHPRIGDGPILPRIVDRVGTPAHTPSQVKLGKMPLRMDDRSATSERMASFGPFRLFPARQLLQEGETPVRVGARALEILNVLVERAGELVSKKELMARVWPNIVAEESNLKVQVAALRRVLGDGQPGRRYLASVPGQGYRFVAPVELSEPQKVPAQPSAGVAHNLPASQTRTLGRADTIRGLLDQLPRRRFITIVGTGGIGKTTVALAVAETLVSAYEHGVRFVDLSPLSEPHFVPG